MFKATSKTPNSNEDEKGYNANKNRISHEYDSLIPPPPDLSKSNSLFGDDELEKEIQKKKIQKKEGAKSGAHKKTTPDGTVAKMPNDVQSKMEKSFNADFSDVNIHANDNSATQMGAQAYTTGNDIHFAPGKFSPNTTGGQELLGHELTHTIQQSQGRVKPDSQQNKENRNINSDKGLEAEADNAGIKAAKGDTVSVQGVTANNNQKKEISEPEEDKVQLKTETHLKENVLGDVPDDINDTADGGEGKPIALIDSTDNATSYYGTVGRSEHLRQMGLLLMVLKLI